MRAGDHGVVYTLVDHFVGVSMKTLSFGGFVFVYGTGSSGVFFVCWVGDA